VDRFRQRLNEHSLVGIDTGVFIAQLEAHPRYLPVTHSLFDAVERGLIEALTSVITLMELTVHPWRKQEAAVARQYEALLVHFPHLRMVDVSRDIARMAAQLRAEYDLRPADGLQVATVLQQGGTALVTNRRQFTRLADRLEILLLDDFV
jgi:predicted nucleic acid-binding protein